MSQRPSRAQPRSLLHLRELVEHAQLGRTIQPPVLEHAREGAHDAEVTDVDRHAHALTHMDAGLAATQLPLVGDVVVDEGGGLEELDGRRTWERPGRLATHRLAAEQHEGGPRALSAGRREAGERGIEVAAELARGERLIGQRRCRMLDEVRLHDGASLGEVRQEGTSRAVLTSHRCLALVAVGVL